MRDTVFRGGSVLIGLDSDNRPLYSDAIAFRDGTVAALGQDAHVLSEDPNGEVVDLEGGTLVPAFGDGHAHPLLAGLEAEGPQVRGASSLNALLRIVKEWKASHPDDDWIVGGSYDGSLTDDGLFDAKWLDEVTGDTPTILRGWNYHTAWVNTAALRAAGITSETPDPTCGEIVRRPDGTPLGTLREAAANDFIERVVPRHPEDAQLRALDAATQQYIAHGITWVQDAWVEPADVDVYCVAAQAGHLHARVNLAFKADPGDWRSQLVEFGAARRRIEELDTEMLTARTVKFFVDGIIENFSAFLTEPYAVRPDERGTPNWAPDELARAVREIDALGFQIHLHAIGDAAVTSALDAIEYAQLANDAWDRRPVIAHAILVRPADMNRFFELGVIANFEPCWAQCDHVTVSQTIPYIGEIRGKWQYLIHSVRSAGAQVSFGSDWPVSSMDWRLAFATAVTRRDPFDEGAERLIPEERVDAATAFAAFTEGTSFQAFAATRGSLRLGNVADAMWLSEDPLQTEASQIPTLAIQGTWLSGKRVSG